MAYGTPGNGTLLGLVGLELTSVHELLDRIRRRLPLRLSDVPPTRFEPLQLPRRGRSPQFTSRSRDADHRLDGLGAGCFRLLVLSFIFVFGTQVEPAWPFPFRLFGRRFLDRDAPLSRHVFWSSASWTLNDFDVSISFVFFLKEDKLASSETRLTSKYFPHMSRDSESDRKGDCLTENITYEPSARGRCDDADALPVVPFNVAVGVVAANPVFGSVGCAADAGVLGFFVGRWGRFFAFEV